MDYKVLAEELRKAESNLTQIEAPTDKFTHMSAEDGYRVQLENVKYRLEQGERLIGLKIGLTSKGMRDLLKVDLPDYGHLFESMLIEGDECKVDDLIQPKVEGEISFVLKSSLKGPNVTAEDVYEATDYVVASLEIVDSRIRDWKIKLPDTIADNGSSARLKLGTKKLSADEVDMRLTGMILEKNGELINSGTAAEVFGNPAEAVACLANMLTEFDIELKAGYVIMAGALTAAIPVEKGDEISATFDRLGSVNLKFI